MTEVKKTIVFKIQRESDGLYSNGGSTPGFTKVGKIWKQKGHLTSHLGQLHDRGLGNYRYRYPDGPMPRHIYDGCKILAFELVEIPVGPAVTVAAYLQEIQERKQKKEQASRDFHEKQQKVERHAQYQKLKHEFG